MGAGGAKRAGGGAMPGAVRQMPAPQLVLISSPTVCRRWPATIT